MMGSSAVVATSDKSPVEAITQDSRTHAKPTGLTTNQLQGQRMLTVPKEFISILTARQKK